MKKLNDIPRAWGNAEPSDPEWEKDPLIERLEAEGHKTLSVDRAVIVIEQCEQGDDFPKGWSSDPLRITIYPDPDAGFGTEPDYLYVHAGRSGLMDILLSEATRDGRRISRLVRVDREGWESLHEFSSEVSAKAVLRMAQEGLTGYYHAQAGDDAAKVKHDEELATLARQAQEAIETYVQKLRTYPDLFKGWRRDTD